MSDVLTEMQGVEHTVLPAVPSAMQTEDPKQTGGAQAAEMALLRHLALEGELALRRDQLAAEHEAVTRRLAQARQQRDGLVAAVREAGGELPQWEV